MKEQKSMRQDLRALGDVYGESAPSVRSIRPNGVDPKKKPRIRYKAPPGELQAVWPDNPS